MGINVGEINKPVAQKSAVGIQSITQFSISVTKKSNQIDGQFY